ncbi:hypothetical protein TNCV_4705961 [Trichonephila clavipes]|nr:hypothetical protein TNCV_4705961 [Trichonephila clavipes]
MNLYTYRRKATRHDNSGIIKPTDLKWASVFLLLSRDPLRKDPQFRNLASMFLLLSRDNLRRVFVGIDSQRYCSCRLSGLVVIDADCGAVGNPFNLTLAPTSRLTMYKGPMHVISVEAQCLLVGVGKREGYQLRSGTSSDMSQHSPGPGPRPHWSPRLILDSAFIRSCCCCS